MRNAIKRIGICFLIATFFWFGTLLSDRQRLNQELIRLHVVANSDSKLDQYRKLRVKDAVTESLQEDLYHISDVNQAKQYLTEKLPYIQSVALRTLRAMGCEDSVEVTLCTESFNTRHYDHFSLPAGIYEALRIVIGDGAGQNWWCVAFPSLCLPAVGMEFEDVAQCAGFPDPLNSSLQHESGYELRFGILDMMGKMENMLFGE